MTNETIGRFLSAVRKERGLTQEQLAEKLGVSNRSVSRWETGKTLPDLSLMQSICQVLDIRIQELLTGRRQQEDPTPEAFAAQILDIANREKAATVKCLNGLFLPGAVVLLAGLLAAFPYLPPEKLPLFCMAVAAGLFFLGCGFYQNNRHPSFTKKDIPLLAESEQQLTLKDGEEMLQFTKKYQHSQKGQHEKAFRKIAEVLEDGEYAAFSMIADSYSVNGHPEPWHAAIAVTDRRVLLCGESVRGRLSTCYIPEDFPRSEIRSIESGKQTITIRLRKDTVVIRGADLEAAGQRMKQILE